MKGRIGAEIHTDNRENGESGPILFWGFAGGDGPVEFGLRSEVKEETNFEVRAAEVREELPVADLRKFMSRLGLDDHALIDQHVDALESNDFALVVDAYCNLALNGVATARKNPKSS